MADDEALRTRNQPDADDDEADAQQFLRAERQTFLRLPRTGAVLFAIHTYVVPLSALSQAERDGLVEARL